jgi:hypothetical protein
MSAQTINKNVQFIDEEKMSICKEIRKLTNGCEKRSEFIQSHVNDMGLSFLEELGKESLKFILRMEIAVTNGTIQREVIVAGFEKGFISALAV